MKKLFLLLLIPFAFACSSDDGNSNNNSNSAYIDAKLIEGEWEHLDGLDSTVYTFKDYQAKDVLYDKYLIKVTSTRNHGYYRLTKENIVFNTYNQPYKLSNDTLYLDEGGGIFTSYSKVKKIKLP